MLATVAHGDSMFAACLLFLAPARALAYEELSADFEDGDLSAWTVVEGSWEISGGVLYGQGAEVGPDLVIEVPERVGVSDMEIELEIDNEGGVGFVYAMDDSGGWCAVLFGNGDAYLADSGRGEALQHAGPLPPGSASTLAISLVGSDISLYHDGLFQYGGLSNCPVATPNAYLGLLTLAGSDTVGIDAVVADWASADTDGDGSEDLDDCAPEDATIYPGAEETYYDGIDQDCRGDDDYDMDGDGYPVDEDCDDDDDDSYPGAIDLWYDGVDSDCLGNDDFDSDGDGVPIETDCNDADANIFPGNTADESDGVDRNCDGEAPIVDDGDSGGGDTAQVDTGGGDKTDTEGCAGCNGAGPLPASGILALATLLLARRR